MNATAKSALRVTHLFPTFRNLGGVEAVLRAHWENDASYGIDSNFVIYFETAEPPIERVSFLGLNGNTTTKGARRVFATAIAKQNPDVCVFHGPWMMKYLADLDGCKRRILIVHGAAADFAQKLREMELWSDGLGAISQPQHEKMLEALPDFTRERMELLHCPIFPPQAAPDHPALAGRPVVIGYCGRLAADAKRVDRAPAFIEALNHSGPDYRMEFLGEGPLEPELKEKFKNNRRIVFHGRQTGARYWEILRTWDFFVLFSDSEGTPISILETMDQGVLPIMPGINSGADFYARQLGPEFVYPPYDFSKACDSIQSILLRPENQIQRLHERASELVSAHHAQNYFKAFVGFVERILSLPRRSSQTPSLPPWPIVSMKFDSFAALTRLRDRFVR